MTNPRSLSAAVCLTLLAGACSGSGSGATSPSAVPADATVTESFSAVVPIGGAVFYSFPIAQFGNVAVTLTGITGTELPEAVGLAIGVGQPGGTTCNVTSVTTVTPGETAQVTGAWGPGIFCVRVADPGVLIAPVAFTAVVAHP